MTAPMSPSTPAESLLETDFAHLDLSNIRSSLIRQEETIIFSLLERAQFKQNDAIYTAGKIPLPDFSGSFLEFLLLEQEKTCSRVRRYMSPDEFPYSDSSLLPPPVLTALPWPQVLAPHKINYNQKIMEAYRTVMQPGLCAPGDDQQYGSSAVTDIACLQALSKRIHYGLFVAESKFHQDPTGFTDIIKAQNRDAIWDKITNQAVEDRVLARVRNKAATYGQDIGDGVAAAGPGARSLVDPDRVVAWFKDIIIPLNKHIQCDYLLRRLDENTAA